MSFVQAASQISTSRLLTFKGDDKRDLKKFILEAHVEGMNEKDLLEILFQDQKRARDGNRMTRCGLPLTRVLRISGAQNQNHRAHGPRRAANDRLVELL